MNASIDVFKGGMIYNKGDSRWVTINYKYERFQSIFLWWIFFLVKFEDGKTEVKIITL